MDIKEFIKNWRKYGAPFILFIQILSMIFYNNIVYGCIMLLWLTVPCGIPIVNKNWWLWYPRQLFFLTFVIIAFSQSFK